MRVIAYGACGGILLLGQIGAAPADVSAGMPGRIELKVVPLERPARVISKADAGGPNGRIASNIVVPTHTLQFGSGFNEYGINVGGAKLTLAMKGTEFTVRNGDKTVNLRRNGIGYAPITVQTSAAGGRDYILAFPAGSASSSRGSLYTRSGGMLRGAIGDQVFTIFDDNVDGRYTLKDDCLRVGSANASLDVFAPASKFVATPTRIYEIKSLAENGSMLEYAPYTGATGRLSIDCDWPDVELHVVIGSQQAQLNCVAMASAKAPAELPVIPGSYDLLYGAVYSTKSNSLVALLGPGSLKEVTVSAGQTAQLHLGGNLQLDFTVDKVPGKAQQIALNSSNFHVKGQAGEEYRSYQWDSNNVPQVAASRGATSVPIGKMSLG
jgi:hypothetical protein